MAAPAGQNEARRLLVAGGSSGIGRAVAERAWQEGWRVAVVARSTDAVAEVLRGRDPAGAQGFVGDLADHGVAHSVIAGLGEAWDGVDAVLYCAAVTHLSPITHTRPSDWTRLFRSNVIGAASVAGAALPALAMSGGRFAALSSDSVAQPMAGLLAYSSSKAALEHLLASLPVEAPAVPVTRIIVGPTHTGLASGFDPELLGRYFQEWTASGWFDGVVPQEPVVVASEIVAQWLDVPTPDLPSTLDLSYLSRP